MAGIYIHIPFCKKACNYCNFHFSTQTKFLPDLIDAIVQEIILRKDYLQMPISTIYFGGGTPSLCSKEQLATILATINLYFEVDQNAEITLEANPDDVTSQHLDDWKSIGINRLSMGIQSFFNSDLQWMNRVHTAEEAINSIQLAQQHGFTNLNIDLIYGTPGLTNDLWQKNLQQAIDLHIPHLSCYALTVEPKTALAANITKGKVSEINTDLQAEQFEILLNCLCKAGYEHYEISNFALPGKRSKHNSSYWQYQHYLGIGPSAHSFNGVSRQWNVANNSLYIKTIYNKEIPAEIEHLSVTDQLNEYIMIGLRTIEGIDLEQIAKIGRESAVQNLLQKAAIYVQKGQITNVNNRLLLTKKGKFLADGIAAALFQ